jgi:hypothetical protein
LLGEERNRWERWVSGRVAKTSWRENKSDGDAELEHIRGLVSVVLGKKGFPFYGSNRIAAVMQTNRCIWWLQRGAQPWSACVVSVVWSWLRGGWQRDITAWYGRGTEKDGVQWSEESTAMGRRTRKAQCISILSL